MKENWTKTIVVSVIISSLIMVGCSSPQHEIQTEGEGIEIPSTAEDSEGAAVSSQDSTTEQQSEETRAMSEIRGFYPEHGSLTCPRPQIGVDLVITDAMRKDGSTFDPSTIKLILDDKDVTDTAIIRENMTFPSTRATIIYTPTTDLPKDTHKVSFAYPSDSGTETIEWSFSVTDMPCP